MAARNTNNEMGQGDVIEKVKFGEEFDVPERLHLSGDHPSDEISITEESNWIYAQLKPAYQKLHKDHIANFLVLHHAQKLEVPFIAMYRREQCWSLLEPSDDDDDRRETKWHKVLWMIQNLDTQWLLLRKRKIVLLAHYESADHFLFESVVKSLTAAETEIEVDDVHSMFSLHFPHGDERLSQYSICKEAGLSHLANKLREQLPLQGTPMEMALNFLCPVFGNAQAVLTGARHMIATEISCELSLRKYVRQIYMQNALVSTTPTPHGDIAIEFFHQLSGVKWLREKPLTMFEGTQWLLIHKAEEDNLLQVSFKLPENHISMLLSQCSKLFPIVSNHAPLWDEQRTLILEEALYGLLLPSMEKEARSLLTSRAKSRLLSEYGQLVWNKVSPRPYPKSKIEGATSKVLACCWGPGNPPITFVILDSSGELVDVLSAGSIALQTHFGDDQLRKRKDQDRLLQFMKDHKPGVVALGAANLSCVRLNDIIYEVIIEIFREIRAEVPNWTDDLSIVYVDETLARLYENSRISGEQLPQQSGIERRAVALGRYLQDPLAMVTTLCGPDREILSWNLHSLENFLEPDEKYRIVEQVMVDITNQVGIDINLAATHNWFFSPLQFISGLGPRRAASLHKSLIRAGSVLARKDLIDHGLSKTVFVNAAGFLRIRRSGLAATGSQSFDPLDDTRVHPESYGLARDLAKDLYDLSGGSNYMEDVTDGAASFRKAVLDGYLGSRKQESKKETCSNILRELSYGFQDWRRQYEAPSTNEELSLISGTTIAEGRIMQATVRRVRSESATCVLDCGLIGKFSKEDYSDDWRDIVDLSERLCEGDILTCKIKSTQNNLPRLFLVCKESEMRNSSHLDPYYYHEEGGSTVRIEKEKDQFEYRMIDDPCFQNITADRAVVYLSDKPFGESVLHPSSRGPNYLTVTLKIYDNVYAHMEIVERGKKNKDVGIGRTLKIGEKTFESLDGLMGWYVGPLVDRLLSMLSHRKFRAGKESELDGLLQIEKGQNPTMVVYCFGVSHEHPGTFILSYIRCINPHHEYIGLCPKGFKFRKRIFRDLDRLVAYFKRHIDDRTVPHA